MVLGVIYVSGSDSCTGAGSGADRHHDLGTAVLVCTTATLALGMFSLAKGLRLVAAGGIVLGSATLLAAAVSGLC